jgi:hypothetical protein
VRGVLARVHLLNLIVVAIKVIVGLRTVPILVDARELDSEDVRRIFESIPRIAEALGAPEVTVHVEPT